MVADPRCCSGDFFDMTTPLDELCRNSQCLAQSASARTQNDQWNNDGTTSRGRQGGDRRCVYTASLAYFSQRAMVVACNGAVSKHSESVARSGARSPRYLTMMTVAPMPIQP
jgi:hypothetical protein